MKRQRNNLLRMERIQMKKEHLMTLGVTLGLVALATAVQAAVGPGVTAWAPMATATDSLQGVPAFAAGTIGVLGGAGALFFGELGHGAQRIAYAVMGAGAMTQAAPLLTAVGVTGALS
jgi:hypothetical protein